MPEKTVADLRRDVFIMSLELAGRELVLAADEYRSGWDDAGKERMRKALEILTIKPGEAR